MIIKKILFYGWLIFSLFLSGLPQSHANFSVEEPAITRELFLKAEKAAKSRNWTLYKKLKSKLIHYPLLPYLLYAEYEQRLDSLSFREFQEFMDNYADSPLSEQLRTRWLQAKAQRHDWRSFLKAYQPTEDLCLQCHYLQAALHLHKDPNVILKQISPLWLNGKVPTRNCEAVFSIWEKSGLMTRSLIWQRIKLLIQEGNESLARKTARYLKSSEKALVELWLMVRNNPYLVTNKKYFTNHPANLEMIVDGISLIAKTKPETAIKMWQKLSHQYPFSERHWALVVRAIGLSYALQRHPAAEKWLSKIPAIHANQSVHEWRIRVALSKEDWPNVLRWTQSLPQHLAKNEEWQYWHARALTMVNRRQESQFILEKLAKSQSYYGFLASNQLLKPYPISNYKIPIERSLIQALAKKSSILRARELYHLGRFTKAQQEWQFITKRMTDKEKHAAAHLSMQWNLPNWAILALSKTNRKQDLSLQFPVVYAKHILQEAQKHQLDPAWILAVARQESSFVPHAKSAAGAIGIMQLIPSTAHMVARKKQLPYFQTHHLSEPHTNIQLGSGYLKMMLEQHRNNSVLATAAYNAGPGRIRKWLPTYDMAADLWIETIPYKETREYVKNVLTYTAIYQEILGKKPTLAKHMPYIRSDKSNKP